MKKSLFTFLFVLIILGYAKPPKNNSTNTTWVESTSIYGNWKWLKTECCGKKTGTTTPESYGDNILLEIKSDNSFKELSDKHRVPRGGILTLTKTIKDDKSYVNSVQFNDERPAHYSLSKNGDTLILSWEYLELQKETYLRTKK